MKVVILEPLGVSQDTLQKSSKQFLPESIQVDAYDARPKDEAELVARAKDADVLVLSNMPLKASALAQCPNVKLLSVAFTGTDHIDTAYCREKGIAVCNCAGYSTYAVSELVFGMAIALLRKLAACDSAARAGGTKAGLIGNELYGKTFGIVGTGAIGLRVAAIANAFGCNVLAYSRTARDVPGVQYVSLDDLLRQSDIVSVHVPQNQNTIKLIDAEKLSLMKPTALLINTARGPIVDADALAQALDNGRVAGAGIDVFHIEPPLDPETPILKAKNTVVAPHIGFATQEAMDNRCGMVFENIALFLKGTPHNVIV